MSRTKWNVGDVDSFGNICVGMYDNNYILMQRFDSTGRNWHEAMLGYNEFVLPSIYELMLIHDYARLQPDYLQFKTTAQYWTCVGVNASVAKTVMFFQSYASIGSAYKDGICHVRFIKRIPIKVLTCVMKRTR